MTKYSEKLKSPLWQRKRLEIMERDDFSCQCCGVRVKTLNVHHLYYLSNTEPWNYKNEALITLCEDCHKSEENSMPVELSKLNLAVKNTCIQSWAVKILASSIIPFIDNPKEMMQFIVDIQKESVKRNNLIDSSSLKAIAQQIVENVK